MDDVKSAESVQEEVVLSVDWNAYRLARAQAKRIRKARVLAMQCWASPYKGGYLPLR